MHPGCARCRPQARGQPGMPTGDVHLRGVGPRFIQLVRLLTRLAKGHRHGGQGEALFRILHCGGKSRGETIGQKEHEGGWVRGNGWVEDEPAEGGVGRERAGD